MGTATTVPELGPAVGRLAEHPTATGARDDLRLEDLRLELITRIFELAGTSRRLAEAGNLTGAMQSLDRASWLAAWEHAVATAAARLTETINAGYARAAAESRFPATRLRHLLLTPDDTRALTARLGSGGSDLVAALDGLEHRGAADWPARSAALSAATRRLESAWLALERAAASEHTRWQAEIAHVRRWRRPTWPLWVATAAGLGLATYLGLVLGGYRPVPPVLQGLADFWWTRLWI